MFHAPSKPLRTLLNVERTLAPLGPYTNLRPLKTASNGAATRYLGAVTSQGTRSFIAQTKAENCFLKRRLSVTLYQILLLVYGVVSHSPGIQHALFHNIEITPPLRPTSWILSAALREEIVVGGSRR